ncbi:zinc-regulated transporter 2 [Trichomonascus vanleenenianus]|uniref:low-affinity Zn(2+) transporter ZRT2 n=1 Tax=Trichomonascus vanleenenianus TaxID=2268995 RepID=UPI003ECB1FF8
MPEFLFFAAKYFGSGVIIATALIHLLQPANEALTSECLSEKWNDYPYAYALCLFSLFAIFLVDLVSQRLLAKAGITHTHGPSGLGGHSEKDIEAQNHHHHHHHHQHHPSHQRYQDAQELSAENSMMEPQHSDSISNQLPRETNQDKHVSNVTAENNTSPSEEVRFDIRSITSTSSADTSQKNIASQLGTIFILEFGIIFHSVFVGLTLAVAGEEFKTLYIVLCFHQLFEGLGLGTRLATAPWPTHRKWVPWALGIAFGLTTPIAIAVGLGLRYSYPPGSETNLITNGIFDSISSGILLYTGLVELIANEFLHSNEFKSAPLGRVLSAYGIMCLGAGLMALLGRWA